MNNSKYILATLLLAFTISACNFTEPDALTIADEKEVYTNITKIRNVLNTVYSGLPNGYTDIGASWLAAACDEAEEVNNAEIIQNFNISSISPNFNPDDVWTKSYESIRNAKIFIQATDTITWKEWQYSNPTEYTRRIALVRQYQAEAKFLTAFFYFELIKRYGGVPLVNEIIDANAEWVSRFPRGSFSDCVDFIVAQCDDAAATLPPAQDSGNYGRATKGAALALKARVLLYAASDLFNQAGNADPLRGYVNSDRKELWTKAAIANKAVIDLTPKYAFNANYQGLFLLESTLNNEVIFERRYAASNTFEIQNTAVGFAQGHTGTCPSGNLVDAYEHLDDGDFNWNNPVHAASPYNKRDPRLAKSIVVNDSKFGKTQATVQLWTGGVNAAPRVRASKTGYYLRKYMNENLDLQLNESSTKQWVFFRLAEIYLNYAEAMNNAFGPDATGPGTLNITARSAINSVRTRAAVGLKAIVAGTTQAKLNEQIRRERRVELAFEGHRYWDIRRWMIADQAIGGTLHGVDVAMNGNGTFTYQPVVIEQRTWNDRLYFYPVPATEVTKSGGVIAQNTGW